MSEHRLVNPLIQSKAMDQLAKVAIKRDVDIDNDLYYKIKRKLSIGRKGLIFLYDLDNLS